MIDSCLSDSKSPPLLLSRAPEHDSSVIVLIEKGKAKTVNLESRNLQMHQGDHIS